MGQEQGKILNDEELRKADIAKMDAEMSRRMGRGVDWNRTINLHLDHVMLNVPSLQMHGEGRMGHNCVLSVQLTFHFLQCGPILLCYISYDTYLPYAVKVLIRGERATGKTCLFERLQGNSFREEYAATPRISVAHIHWSYKSAPPHQRGNVGVCLNLISC
jgi:hypothetical protein